MSGTIVTTVCSMFGVEAAALVDMESGECLEVHGGTPHFAQMACHNAGALRAQLKAMRDGQDDPVEDWLLTTRNRYELIRFLPQAEAKKVFLYLSLSRSQANLALIRHKLKLFTEDFIVTDTFQYQLRTLRHETGGIAEGTKFGTGRGTISPNSLTGEEELPPFMRLESVRRLLGIDRA